MYLLEPSPQGQETYDFMILLDSSGENSGENEVLFVKIGARVFYLWLDMSFESRWLKCGF